MDQIYCDLCGSEKADLYYEIPDLWLERFSIKSRFYLCEECGLIYQYPQPSIEEIPEFYPTNYFNYQIKHDRFLDWGLKKRSRCVRNYKTHGMLLDIGAANGEFIAFMRDKYNWDVVGIEPNPWTAKLARDKYNLQVIDGYLEQSNFSNQLFDVVTLWDVLEHLHNPKKTLLEVHRILKSDGILVLRLPNFDSIDAKLFGRYWAGFDSPRHLYVYKKATIKLLLAQCGFTILSMNTGIGGYLNMLKSVQFWLTGIGANVQFRSKLIWLLKTVPVRILAAPFVWLKDQGLRGSELVVIALPVIN